MSAERLTSLGMGRLGVPPGTTARSGCTVTCNGTSMYRAKRQTCMQTQRGQQNREGLAITQHE